MRVKVGNTWFECGPGQPIMVELSEADKRNLDNMDPKATKYALFCDEDRLSTAEKTDWMKR